MFASSSGASISSSMQNGVGFIKKLAKRSDMAVNAFSPPERRAMFSNLFPVGWATISIPDSKGLFSSTSTSDALPPPKIDLNTLLKVSFNVLNVSMNNCFVVLFILPIAFCRSSMDCIRSACCFVRNSYLCVSS